MTRAYRWRCFACDKPNAASATACSSCGFPATATGAEIARAQAAHRTGAAPLQSPDRPAAASLAQKLAPWRGWPMGVGIAGAVLLALGAYAGKNLLSWRGLGVSILALMFGLAFLVIAWAAGSEKSRKRGASMSNPPANGSSADRAFVHSRLIDAPRERVFKAFADPAHLARWWGPDGFTSTFDTFDFRPGGQWRFVMHGPDGTDYLNESVFREVVAPERIVLEHLREVHHFFLTITFAAQGDKTLVGWRQVFDTAEHKERVARMVVPANEQNLDRLANEVRNVA